MRTILLIAGSTLALAIAAPVSAQTALPSAGALPKVGSVPKVGSLPATPVAKPRVGHSNRPSVKLNAPVSRTPLVSGKTIAQVKAPRSPGDGHIVRVKSADTRGLLGSGSGASVKRNGVQATALGRSQGLNTKKSGLPLTPVSGATNAVAGAGHGALSTVTNSSGGALGGNGHGALGATVGRNPGLIVNPGSGRKH